MKDFHDRKCDSHSHFQEGTFSKLWSVKSSKSSLKKFTPQHSQILYNFGCLLEILFKSQIERLSYGGDHILRQTTTTLQHKARSTVLLVLRHIGNEIECLLGEESFALEWFFSGIKNLNLIPKMIINYLNKLWLSSI